MKRRVLIFLLVALLAAQAFALPALASGLPDADAGIEVDVEESDVAAADTAKEDAVVEGAAVEGAAASQTANESAPGLEVPSDPADASELPKSAAVQAAETALQAASASNSPTSPATAQTDAIAPLATNSGEFRAASYPWAPGTSSGNYIADSYSDVPAKHVFEDVTQERLLDILSSAGNYYIVLAGPSRPSAQTILATLNEQAQAAGIAKIYHFDPLIDGYQADITQADTPYKTSASIHELWTRITALLPTGEPLASYKLTDTLLVRYRASSIYGTRGNIDAAYSFAQAQVGGFSAAAEKPKIDAVFKKDGKVLPASVRSDLQFFNRVYNASATLVNSNMLKSDPVYGVDAGSVELFAGLTEANFKLHQLSFPELQNLYQSPGEHIILYGASWCHNTQAIIGTIASQAAKNASIQTVYVYDTTLGNQISFGRGAQINTASKFSSTFNSRNDAKLPEENNVSYIYGEAVRPLGSFLTQDTTYQSNSIRFYANGDQSGAPSSVEPWLVTATTPAEAVNAGRLQLPFLIAYNKDASGGNKAVRQWLHAQKTAANAGKYLEYMLELAWVRAGQCASAAEASAQGVLAAYQSAKPYANGGVVNDEGLTLAAMAAEAIEQVNYVLQVSSDQGNYKAPDSTETGDDPVGSETPADDTPTQPSTGTPATTNTPAAATTQTAANNQPTTRVTFQPGPSGQAASGNTTGGGSTSAADSTSGSPTQLSTSSTQAAFTNIPEAATPLGQAASPATDTADMTVPFAATLLLVALAIAAVIAVASGLIPLPKTGQSEGGV